MNAHKQVKGFREKGLKDFGCLAPSLVDDLIEEFEALKVSLRRIQHMEEGCGGRLTDREWAVACREEATAALLKLEQK